MNEKEKKLLVQSREEGRSIENKPQRGLTIVGGSHEKEGSRAITEAIEKFSERMPGSPRCPILSPRGNRVIVHSNREANAEIMRFDDCSKLMEQDPSMGGKEGIWVGPGWPPLILQLGKRHIIEQQRCHERGGKHYKNGQPPGHYKNGHPDNFPFTAAPAGQKYKSFFSLPSAPWSL